MSGEIEKNEKEREGEGSTKCRVHTEPQVYDYSLESIAP